MIRKLLLTSAFFLTVVFLAACGKAEKNQPAFDLANLDTTVAPGEDFYKYAVGNWAKNNPIPAEYTRWGTFEQLAEENYKVLKQILENAAANKNSDDPNIAKVGKFYALGMDTAKIEEQGIEPLAPEFERIEKISDKSSLIKELAHIHLYTGSPLFAFYAGQDAKNSEMMVASLYQSGLGLPDRDYYTSDDERSKDIREKYTAYMTEIFELLGKDPEEAKKAAETVMSIETRLAEKSMTRLEERDPVKTYNKMTIADLKKLTPAFDWDLYLKELNVEDPGEVNVSQPEFMTFSTNLIDQVSIDDWKTYFTWHVINPNASFLNSDFVDARFNFYSKFLNGAESQRPRWKTMMFNTDRALGEVVGQIYVADHFSPEAKAKANELVQNLLAAMGDRIKKLEWMSEETKEKALKKLSAFKVKIGYPDKWRDYSDLEIKEDAFVANMIRSNYFNSVENLEKINKPVDRTEWEMYPQTVNAYYHPLLNEIAFPAAILQPPFFSADYDDAINYGAIGAVIGHEITHGFDDQGRQFDFDGNIRDWWTQEDNEKFNERTKLIIDQYAAYEPLEGFFVDGELTQGENIADLGGLTVSYTAFKKTEQYKNGEVIDGFTPSQRFFLGWAQAWKNNIRDENLKLRLKTDPHSPGYYRVNGPLVNMPEFHTAFNLKEGETMVKPADQRVKIW